MIWQVIKKQALTFMRNRQHLVLLILLPIILITILSFALGGFMDGESVTIEAKIAITKAEEDKQIQLFTEEVGKLDIPEQEKEGIFLAANQTRIISFITDVFQNNFPDQIEVVMIEKEEVGSTTENDSFTAIIDVPENFTYDLLRYLYLEEGELPSLTLSVHEEKQLGSSMVKHILAEIEEQLALFTYTANEGVQVAALMPENFSVESSIRSLNKANPKITSKEYYTFSMAVMNVLFIAATIGAYAYQEKETHVFDRIILSNASPWKYFFGIYVSTTIFAFLQLTIIFTAAKLIFNVDFYNSLGVFVVTLALSSAVGGLSLILTALSFRFNSIVLINYFQSIIVTAFAFVGGSFFPVGGFSEFIGKLGDLTPNGASLSAYLHIIRGADPFTGEVLGHLLYLIVFSTAILVIAVLCFPKRGQKI